MATYTKVLLSGSTDGAPIAVAATATPGTLIHTAHATALDEIWIWASCVGNSDAVITVEWGGTATSNHLVDAMVIPAHSYPICIIPGGVLTNSKVLRVFATAANVVNVWGFVNRIT
jgi:hypothetical protein